MKPAVSPKRSTPTVAMLIRLMALSVPLIAACGGGGGDGDGATVNPTEVVPVSRSQFGTVESPTFNQFIETYKGIVLEDPPIEADLPRLRQEIYERMVKLTGKKRASEVRKLALAVGSFSEELGIKLTEQEWDVVYDNPVASYFTWAIIKPSAFNESERFFSCGVSDNGAQAFNDNKADAYRHAYWNARMTREISAEFAERIGTAHEEEATSQRARMDLHNNEFGRLFALRYPRASLAELEILLSQQRYFYVNNQNEFPDPREGLVFFSELQALDAVLTGELTNPDSGGPWRTIANFSQCATTVRGVFQFVRGSTRIDRRFAGVVGEAGGIQIVIDEPFSFEGISIDRICTNMKVGLDAVLPVYSGRWTAQNCPQGGTLTLRP